MGLDSERWTLPVDRDGRPRGALPRRAPDAADVRLEPLPGLEWSLATESDPPIDDVSPGTMSPESLRRGWVHRAAERRVLTLFRKLSTSTGQLPAPWWLKALDREEIPSRAEAFDLEDGVHELLTSRRGWVFVPWGGAEEAGYWEYAPSERKPMTVPTTVMMTDRHRGWVVAVPAHAEPRSAVPVPVRGLPGLAAGVARIETW